jgi:mRNA interferase RelE/StbE
MAWAVEFDAAADRDLKKIDQQQKRRILKYLRKKIATKKDPRRFGDPLRKNLTGLWKYRICDYRVICDIQDEKVLVLVLRVGHRSKVYGGH